MKISSQWPDERIEQLKALYAAGFSSSQIGKELGATRNAVIGKVHRLGLTRSIRVPHERRPVSERQPRKPKSPAPVVKIKRSPPLHAFPEPFIPKDNPDHTFLHKTVLELETGLCKWPSGDRGNFTFCCQPTFAKDRVYCPSHHALSLRCTEAA